MSFIFRIIACLVIFVSGAASAAADKSQNRLEIYVYPPSRPLKWDTPRDLMRSFLKIYRKQVTRGMLADDIYSSSLKESTVIKEKYLSTMGHTIVRTSCTTTTGEVFRSWSSFSGQDYVEADKEQIIDKKAGFAAIFHDYIDGHIIAGEENINRLIYYKGWDYFREGNILMEIPGLESLQGAQDYDYFGLVSNRRYFKPRYISMKVTPEKCNKIKEMVQFFGDEKFKIDPETTYEELKSRYAENPRNSLHFTNTMDPLESYTARLKDPNALVGGGCAPYGVSMMKLAGYYSQSLDDIFLLKVNISKGWMHDPKDPETSDKPIHFEDIVSRALDSDSNTWGKDGFKSRAFNQHDPQLIWDFIGEAKACLGEPIREFEDTPCSPRAKAWLAEQKTSGVVVRSGETITYTNERYDDRLYGVPKIITGGESVTESVQIEGINLEK